MTLKIILLAVTAAAAIIGAAVVGVPSSTDMRPGTDFSVRPQ